MLFSFISLDVQLLLNSVKGHINALINVLIIHRKIRDDVLFVITMSCQVNLINYVEDSTL